MFADEIDKLKRQVNLLTFLVGTLVNDRPKRANPSFYQAIDRLKHTKKNYFSDASLDEIAKDAKKFSDDFCRSN